MWVAKNLDELTEYIKNDIAVSFMEDVFPVVQRKMIKHIALDVYEEYNPKAYYRRYNKAGREIPHNFYDDTDNKGLLSDENIKPYLGSRGKNIVNLWVLNETLGSKYYVDKEGNLRRSKNAGKPIAGIIETGIGYDLSSRFNAKPRPFVQNTYDELSSNNDHVKALIQSLRAKGYDII